MILETDNLNAKASCRVLKTFNIFLKIVKKILPVMSFNARK